MKEMVHTVMHSEHLMEFRNKNPELVDSKLKDLLPGSHPMENQSNFHTLPMLTAFAQWVHTFQLHHQSLKLFCAHSNTFALIHRQNHNQRLSDNNSHNKSDSSKHWSIYRNNLVVDSFWNY